MTVVRLFIISGVQEWAKLMVWTLDQLIINNKEHRLVEDPVHKERKGEI